MLGSELNVLGCNALALATEEALTHVESKGRSGDGACWTDGCGALEIALIVGDGEHGEATKLLRECHLIEVWDILLAMAAQDSKFSE